MVRRSETPGPGASASQSLRQLVRGVAGGLLLGLPPLFTMEMWFQGFLLDSWKIVVLLVVTYVIVVGYSAIAGFRRERTPAELLIDSLATMGVAAVVSVVALALLGRIGPDVGLRDAIGKVALQMIPAALGVSLAGTQLADPDDDGVDAEDQGSPLGERAGAGSYGRLLVAAGAALFFSLNIAPTEETIFLVTGMTWWLMVAVILASLAMSFAIVFYADFRGGRTIHAGDSPIDRPIGETLVAYGISLLVSALLVWAFGRVDGVTAYTFVGQVVLLGVVAAFGAAAGRLLIGGPSNGKAKNAKKSKSARKPKKPMKAKAAT